MLELLELVSICAADIDPELFQLMVDFCDEPVESQSGHGKPEDTETAI
jgi:hypothetical protein